MTCLRITVLASLLLGCSKTPELQAEEKKPTPVASASAASSTSAPAEIAYDVPKSWEVQPNTNAMRKATIKVPKQGGDTDDAELTVSTAGGGKEANIGRWCTQFGLKEPTKTEERNVNGLPVTILEMKGPYAGMGGAKKDSYMLLGAVVPGAHEQLHFFKLTGPEKTVTASRKDFDAFVASLRAK